MLQIPDRGITFVPIKLGLKSRKIALPMQELDQDLPWFWFDSLISLAYPSPQIVLFLDNKFLKVAVYGRLVISKIGSFCCFV
jgi:hypothetical protein